MFFPAFKSSVCRRIALLAVALVCCPLGWAQHAHPQPTGATETVPAQASETQGHKPAARKPRLQLGVGVALAPDGALWLAGLNAENQLFVQTAPAPVGAAPWQWGAPRVLDTAGDAISADGENHPKLLWRPPSTVLIAYTQPLPKPNTGYVRMLRSVDGGRPFPHPSPCMRTAG